MLVNGDLIDCRDDGANGDNGVFTELMLNPEADGRADDGVAINEGGDSGVALI